MSKPKKLAFYPFYPSDFDSDTQLLTACEVGEYLRLLNIQWKNGKMPLKKIPVLMEDYDKSWSEIEQYFTIEDGLVFNKRLEKERVIAQAKHDKAVTRARAGADARWNAPSNATSNTTSIPKAMPQAMLTHNSELIPHNTEEISHNSVLRAHNAFNSISTKKASNHEIMQITQLCHDNSLESVLTAIDVMGDHSWHSIRTLKKVLSGELPKTDEETTIQYDPEAMV